ncbi:hypothetical protein ACFWVP_17060 [Streptomyces sp. NPDC058637]|uniref:hypothetical protein n=1 Tax=Streptomyces sp. NPDC058637 TaxID=3346569 RepID=UPI003665C3B1
MGRSAGRSAATGGANREAGARAALTAQWFEVEDVREAPGRPVEEFVFVARRPSAR